MTTTTTTQRCGRVGLLVLFMEQRFSKEAFSAQRKAIIFTSTEISLDNTANPDGLPVGTTYSTVGGDETSLGENRGCSVEPAHANANAPAYAHIKVLYPAGPKRTERMCRYRFPLLLEDENGNSRPRAIRRCPDVLAVGSEGLSSSTRSTLAKVTGVENPDSRNIFSRLTCSLRNESINSKYLYLSK
ncbi:uncharacterized protein LOC124294267 [Neodiprion lecontei]|uniref:Uncharacterized protein LOC124294267 n=1 Tax=Neodiprion lecontei TaxID=441921 RepID=A0ABM3G4H8_NEOLC|nr:uncharacterized protein LOC124294267 [Neodiprion lecontei]